MQLASLIAQLVLPAMQKTLVRFLDRDDPLLAWRVPWTV